MKRFIREIRQGSRFTRALLLATALGLAAPVIAAFYAVQDTPLNGGTATVAPNTTNSYSTVVLDISNQEVVALELSFKCTLTNSLNSTLTFVKGVRSGVWDTNGTPFLSWVVACNGTNTVLVTTNLVTGGYGYVALASILNPNTTSAMTNVSLKYSIKRTGE